MSTQETQTPGGQPESEIPRSPRWGSTTKIVVGLALVAVLGALVVGFRNIIGPLILAFVIAYLLYPLADWLHLKLKMGWRLAVNLIYLLVVLIILGLLTWGGFLLVEQVGALIKFLEKQVANLPQLIENLSNSVLQIGPFTWDLENLEIENLANQVLSTVQPLFGQVGGLFGTFASSAAVFIGWTLFILLISYFILIETEGVPQQLFRMRIPGYQQDINRLGQELAQIWNAFLRGQLIIFFITVALYTAMFGALGVSFFYGLALVAGMARFVPYVGPAVAWAAYGLVAFFQGHTIFGLEPLPYALIVVGIAWVTDLLMDNFFVPRFMGDALRVHPAAVMVAALVGASLLGVIGVVLAAPVLATAKLFLDYVFRKLMDVDPWEGRHGASPPPSLKESWSNLLAGVRRFFARLQALFTKKQGEGK